MNEPHYHTSVPDEIGIIGCCLLGGLETTLEAVETVPLDALSDPDVREVFGVLERLATANREINNYTLYQEWRKTNGNRAIPPHLLSAHTQVPSALNLPYYVEGVVIAWRTRRIIEVCYSVYSRGQNPNISPDDLLMEIERALSTEDVHHIHTLKAKVCQGRMIDDLERRHKLGGALSGVATGFGKLDDMTDGLQYGDQTVIGARPSAGKSALGLGILMHATFRCGIPSLFVTLEMSVEALMRRMCSSWADFDLAKLRRGSYSEDDFRSITAFSAKMLKMPFWITDAVGGLTITQLCALIRRRARKDGVKLVVIDYLQKILPSRKQEKRTYELAEVSSSLRACAVDTGVAMLTLAQLNRDSEKDKTPRPPRLCDLAECGQIERDADTVALIHRDRADVTGKSLLIVSKQRDGATGPISLVFNSKYARFENPSYT